MSAPASPVATSAAPPEGLWQDLVEVPQALSRTIEHRDGFDEAAALVGRDGVRRVVVSGNGAAYYVATALWLASLEGRSAGPAVCAVPSGLLARGGFSWREGDLLVAVSSSGEFRDLVEAVSSAPRPFLAVTSSPASTLGEQADVRAVFSVLSQRAVTHTQVVCGAIAAVLSIWADVTRDASLREDLLRLPAATGAVLSAAAAWGDEAAGRLAGSPRCAVVCGSGPAWSAALEGALLLKEVAGVPAEGAETREAATSCMYALDRRDLVLTLPTGHLDPLLEEAEGVLAATGATVLRAPRPDAPLDRRLAGVVCFPPPVVLSIALARRAGLDVDRPAWVNAYYGTARRAARGPADGPGGTES